MLDGSELTPLEQRTARTRLGELAEQFTRDGVLRGETWREVFQRTWRHPYVPGYYPNRGANELVTATEPHHREQWLGAVYSDESLITKRVPTPHRKTGWFTSSSTMPSVMLTMLEALEVRDGHRILEVGTGSGYNAALLSERLGSELVTSIDIDPELVELARTRLAHNGYKPTVAAADGAAGYPAGAPYDRIIATCSVPAIPPAWLDQLAPGGIIMTDVRGALGGTVVRVSKDQHGTATGRFLPCYISFMTIRPAAEAFSSVRARPLPPANAQPSTSAIDPQRLQRDGHLGFITQWHLPDATIRPALSDEGQQGTQLDTPDGSIAQVWHGPRHNRFAVTQAGPRRLWDRVEQAHQFWHDMGRPNYDRFGITVTATSNMSGTTTPPATIAGNCSTQRQERADRRSAGQYATPAPSLAR